MVCERRAWSDECECLYTDDPRVHEAAMKLKNMKVVSTYFKSKAAERPVAWDILGSPSAVASLTRRFAGKA